MIEVDCRAVETVVRLRSKGLIVIPVEVRRRYVTLDKRLVNKLRNTDLINYIVSPYLKIIYWIEFNFTLI